jgi:hypothetical protein
VTVELSKADILLKYYLDGQSEKVIFKYFKEALSHLNERQIQDLIEKYEADWHGDYSESTH